MKLTQMFLDQLDREAARTRNVVENVPKGKDDWTPHPKSMPLVRLAGMVATMPSWISLIIDKDEIDLNPPAGKGQYQQPSAEGLVPRLDKAVSEGRASLKGTTDEKLLNTSWRILMGGKAVSEALRHIVIADTFSHLAHHRGQLTVYLRLLDQKVGSTYGPSADDQRFA
jgi:uncharacterized damage-inducible protein DinB